MVMCWPWWIEFPAFCHGPVPAASRPPREWNMNELFKTVSGAWWSNHGCKESDVRYPLGELKKMLALLVVAAAVAALLLDAFIFIFGPIEAGR